MAARDQLHHLVDKLPAEDLHAAQRYLEFLHGSNGDYDDEPLSNEALAAMAESKAEIARGDSIALEDLKLANSPQESNCTR
jgi:hypothetical protein